MSDQQESNMRDEVEKAETSSDNEGDITYPALKKTVPAIISLFLAIFVVALDRTILGTAVPSITNEFQSFGDVAWYEAAYLFPLCALLLSLGRVYTFYPSKWVLVICVTVFEIGSIVCATAKSSNAIIVGRTISGAGSAGVSSGVFITINQLVRLQARPKVTGGVGSMFGLASILGPILGGYLTGVSWRWCFWINVPIGAVSVLVLILLAPHRPAAREPARTLRGKIEQLDPVGFILIAPAVICILFALQFGGIIYPWSDGRVIALFVLFGVLGAAFVSWQIWRKESATIPPRLLRQRSVLFGCFVNLGVGSVLVIFPFYLPIWFQVVQGKSPQESGLSLIPLLLSNVVAVIASGILTSKLGYYTPWLITGSVFLIVGSALISTFEPGIEAGKWIGYQILTGIGVGLTLQQPNIAAQTVLAQRDVALGLSLLTFITFLGGSIFVTVCQTLLNNGLVHRLSTVLPDIDASSIANGGATSLRTMVSEEQLPLVLQAYNDSVRSIWYLALGLSCLTFLASFGFEWKSVKGEKTQRAMAEA